MAIGTFEYRTESERKSIERAKELVKLRLKRNGARWRAERVGAFVELLALCTAERKEHWNALAM